MNTMTMQQCELIEDLRRDSRLSTQRECMRALRFRRKLAAEADELSRQSEMRLFGSRRVADAEVVKSLVHALETRPEWLSARSLAGQLGVDDRIIRMAAECACPLVISGQSGYKHTAHATAPEVREFCARMESQARRMLERVAKVRAYQDESRRA